MPEAIIPQKTVELARSETYCAAVGIAEGITSENTVGYATSETLSAWGATMVTPQFITVASTTGTFKLGEVRPVGDDVADTVTIQILNDDGTTDISRSYTWNGESWANDGSGTDATEVSIIAGTGFWTYANTDEDTTFQSAGEVNFSDVSFTLSPWGAIGVGNPFPVPRTLGDITPVGDDTSDTVTIQILNDDGTTDISRSYTWNGTAWVNDGNNTDASDVVIGAGVGMWVYSNSDEDAALLIPAPTL